MKLELSVVTLTWNSDNYIEMMLDSLIEKLQISNIKFEIFIVDNGSTDDTLNKIKRFQTNSNVNLIKFKENIGTTKSRNVALEKCRYDKILIVDSDTEFTNTDFVKLINAFETLERKDIGIIQPKLVHPTGEVQDSALPFPSLKNKFQRFLGDTRSPYDLTSIQPVDYCISAAWLVKREVFKNIGLLDERIFYAPEDAEFCKRLWKKNYQVWYYPEVEITHHYQRLTSKKKFTKMWFSHLKGLLYFWLKYL